jgi:hypothetical protein
LSAAPGQRNLLRLRSCGMMRVLDAGGRGQGWLLPGQQITDEKAKTIDPVGPPARNLNCCSPFCAGRSKFSQQT